ncbi:MAG: hypothetical protein JNL11_20020 [Bdellovibrionaceae bacterium]|nr:hypothetical protein [Pseudobdellovibrionaceae bacterium]
MKIKMVFSCVAVAATTSYILASCAQKPATTRPDVTYAPPPNLSREPSSDVDNNSTWSQWSKKNTISGLLELSRIRTSLFTNNLKDPHISYLGYKNAKKDCNDTNENRFRSADGTCTDTDYPMSGAAGTAFGRNVDPKDIDHQAAQKLQIPNPDTVSKEFFTRDKFKPVPFLNMIAASWIQFMNHDWFTHGPNMKGDEYVVRSEDGNRQHVIDRTQEISADLSQFKKEFGRVNANDVTHWWDGSQIYGSSREEQNELRTGSLGKMKTSVVPGTTREILPKVADGKLNPANNRQNQGYELTGFRDNWWVGLSMLHTLFVKEHNAIADEIMKKHVRKKAGSTDVYIWKNGKDQRELTAKELDHEIFQTARLVNAAVMAKIHTVEWTPAILPNDALKFGMNANWNGLLNPNIYSKGLSDLLAKVKLNKADFFKNVDLGHIAGGIVGGKYERGVAPYSLTEEFTSVYRLHPLLPENITIKNMGNRTEKSVPFINTRNHLSYDIMAGNDLKDLFYSFGTQHPGQLVTNNFPKFMQELEIPGHPKMDLALVDILRDRERGVPRYNQFRKSIGLKPIKSYKDFFKIETNNGQLTDAQVDKLNKFYKVYGRKADGTDNVEDIDVLVGAYAEEIRPDGFGFGETQFQIFILMATRRLMADRFFTKDFNEEHYTRTGLYWVNNATMSKVILRHMPELAPKLKGVETAFNPWNN